MDRLTDAQIADFATICREGGAQVSLRHANFIFNTGGARAEDVLRLINRINDTVAQATGFRIQAEACYVAPSGRISPADQQERDT